MLRTRRVLRPRQYHSPMLYSRRGVGPLLSFCMLLHQTYRYLRWRGGTLLGSLEGKRLVQVHYCFAGGLLGLCFFMGRQYAVGLRGPLFSVARPTFLGSMLYATSPPAFSVALTFTRPRVSSTLGTQLCCRRFRIYYVPLWALRVLMSLGRPGRLCLILRSTREPLL